MKIFNAVKNPKKVLRYLRNKMFLTPRMRRSQRSFLENMLLDNINDFIQITDEIINDNDFHKHLSRQFQSANLSYSQLSRESWPVSNYYLIRKLKPRFLIETGVWHGLSTCYILKALKANTQGQLISFDLPAHSEEGGYKDLNPLDDDDIISLPLGKNPGWIVPDYLHNIWKLVLGKTEDTLPPIIKNLKKIDFFLHDSEHSYSNMLFEFKIAYRHLSEGGVLVGDNINWNNSFYDFCEEENLGPHTYLAYLEDPTLKHPFGGIRKI